ncbi:hypothetical protein DPMN_095507 [Dreissena polymorpha]|uniref:Uncharacterized protein n=1 Tax=Dreissena polymorpha TaxID=45954 RepID=A0A9D4L7Q3_DREPO|nr:hypothetical protein DPMN_095507 [Dreissena polymorpha]
MRYNSFVSNTLPVGFFTERLTCVSLGDLNDEQRSASPTRGILKRSSTFDDRQRQTQDQPGMSHMSRGRGQGAGRVMPGGRQTQGQGMMMAAARSPSPSELEIIVICDGKFKFVFIFITFEIECLQKNIAELNKRCACQKHNAPL